MTEGFRVGLAAPELVIENEIARGLTQRQIAQTYALALRAPGSAMTDWARINKAILDRWSPRALERIKQMAWDGNCFDGEKNERSGSGGEDGGQVSDAGR